MKKAIVIPVIILLIILFVVKPVRANSKINSYRSKGLFYPVTGGQMKIRNDDAGKGHYHSPRGNRKHNGIDIEIEPIKAVYAPIDGYISREFKPYSNDSDYWGIEIEGTGIYSGYRVKIMYVSNYNVGTEIKAGDKIAVSQSISNKYGSEMIDHLHIELYENNVEIDPTEKFFNLLA